MSKSNGYWLKLVTGRKKSPSSRGEKKQPWGRQRGQYRNEPHAKVYPIPNRRDEICLLMVVLDYGVVFIAERKRSGQPLRLVLTRPKEERCFKSLDRGFVIQELMSE